EYLESIAVTQGDTCLIFHNEPDGRDLHYLGWCHGPVGTARLWYRLFRVTCDCAWMEWAGRSARAVLQSGIPQRQTPGFWNNAGQCCGSAGVAEFMLDLHRVTGNGIFLDFARKVTGHLLGAATAEGGGLKWIQAEHRTRPEFLVAQTGYMQGAAGIGMWLLHLDAFERGVPGRIVLPDSLFQPRAGSRVALYHEGPISPCSLATTAETRQLPVVLVAVLGMSRIGSIPIRSPIPAAITSAGSPMDERPAAVTTSADRGTPAIPLLATKSVPSRVACSSNVIEIWKA
ncbi:MAG: hypothetical protein FJW35_18095, partial [Acidobacteria bacterium]|nr:hypothetical protein [Acidobacteriota bacterium]